MSARSVLTAIVLAVVGVAALLLLAVPERQDLRPRAAVTQAVILTAPAREALESACAQGALQAGMDHEALELLEPTGYQDAYTRSVAVAVPEDDEATITATLREIAFDGTRCGASGAEILIQGQCGRRAMTWRLGGDVAPGLLPRLRGAAH
jgi:hypothetical protein